MRINKYLLVALLYFFVDVLFLPPGLTYTTLLAPILYYWIINNGGKWVITKAVIFCLPFTIVHLFNGVHMYFYIRSWILYLMVYVLCYAIYIFIKKKQMLESVFKQILLINFGMTIIAIIAFFTPLDWVFWTFRKLTAGINEFPRLEMFTFEPSHYSMLFAPIAIYYTLKLLLKPYPIHHMLGYLTMVFLPLILSFSLGVISSLGLTIVILCTINFRRLISRTFFYYAFISGIVAVVSILVLLLVFYPENALFVRIENLFVGKDTSGKGRMLDSIKLAWWLLSDKSYVFGIGYGQVKVVGEQLIREYYNYNPVEFPVVRILSSTGETLAIFGVLGLLIKFGLEIYLFIKTRTHENYFREAAFIFIFIYQFTGGFLNSIPEYVLWIIAFTPCCHFFDKHPSAAISQQKT